MKEDDDCVEIELELDQYLIDYLNERARLEDKTIDTVVEDIIKEALRDWGVDDSKE